MIAVTKPADDYRLRFTDRILDSVHGYIDITSVEKELIELPVFKRLQSIKQLSLVNWVFPGAEHTRYTHSLGVMFIVDKMASQLKFSDGDRQLIRLAGLLHDIGHYPLSHVGESSYKRSVVNYDNFLHEHSEHIADEIKNMTKPFKIICAGDLKDKPYHHEAIGAKLIEHSEEINKIIKKNCNFIEPMHICDIITGKYTRFPELSAMIQLMHSELDADRMDYLLRDATFSGTSYGTVDTGIIIKNLTLEHIHGVDIIGIKPKGISAADQYVLNRYFSKTQIICNRHVSALEFMAQALIRYLSDKKLFDFPSVNGLPKYVKRYEKDSTFLRFTDHLFWNAVYAIDKEDDSIKYPLYITEFARMLSKHREIATVQDSEAICSDLNHTQIAQYLEKTPSYKNLQSNLTGGFKRFTEDCDQLDEVVDEYKIQKLHIVNLTDSIPKSKFDEMLSALESDPEKFAEREKEYSKFRLQDGLAVIDKGATTRSTHLLVDDNRSLIKNLYMLKTAIVREYYLYKHDV